MSQAAQNLRDILSLARMLRQLAGGHTHDRTYHQFLTTATELEQRANTLAAADRPQGADSDTALHAPVNLVI